jgi:hypothetical protein
MNINALKREKKRIVFNFFNAIKEKDVENMLDLFDDKCTVIEPFSIAPLIDDKDDLKSFFSTMCYACDGVDCSLSFDEGDKDFECNTRCEFRLGDSVTGFFRFKFKPFSSDFKKNESLKIRELDISF